MQLRLVIIGGVNAAIAVGLLLARGSSPKLATRAPFWVFIGYLAVSLAVLALGILWD